MAVALFMRLSGVSPRQYDRVIAGLELDVHPAIGQVVHIAAEDDGGVLVCDVWQTHDAAESFVRDTLEPWLAQLGLRPELEYEIMPLHNLFAPDMDTIERIGAVSLPAVAAGATLR